MILTLTASTASMIKMKARELHTRIISKAIFLTVGEKYTVPDFDVAFDVLLLTKEIRFCYRQLGLDDDSLKNRAELESVECESLKAIVLQNFPHDVGMDSLKILSKSLQFDRLSIMDIWSKIDIPILGRIIANPMSFVFIFLVLYDMIDKMEKASLDLVSSISSFETEDLQT